MNQCVEPGSWHSASGLIDLHPHPEWNWEILVTLIAVQIVYQLPFPEDLKNSESIDEEEWLCLAKSIFLWGKNSWMRLRHANPTYSKRFTPKGEKAVGQRVSLYVGLWRQFKFMILFSGSNESWSCSVGMSTQSLLILDIICCDTLAADIDLGADWQCTPRNCSTHPPSVSML